MEIIKKYERHILLYNLLLVAGIVYILKKANCLFTLSTLDDTFFGTLAGIFVSILGFSMAAVSILIAIIHGINEDNKKIQLVRESKWYGKIYDMYLYTILFSGISAGLSILSMKSHFMIIRILWMYFSLLAGLYLCLSIVILKLIISLLTSKPKEEEKKTSKQEIPRNTKVKEWDIK